MKCLSMILLVLLISLCALAADKKVSKNGIVAGINAPQTLRLMGDTYAAGYSASNSTNAIVEYYRAGEGRKSWKRMLALRLIIAGPTSLEQVKGIEKNIRAGGSSAVRVYKDRDTDGYGIEFILPAHGYQELDVFRYVN